MTRYPLQQLMRQFPLLANPFWRNRSPWDELDEGLLPAFQSTPGVTMYEQGNQLVVEAELPGLRPEDVEVTFSKGVLSIRGEQLQEAGEPEAKKGERQEKAERAEKAESSDTKRFYYRSQRSWAYSLALPIAVDESREPQATFKDGVMKVLFNKAQRDTTKRIQVKKG